MWVKFSINGPFLWGFISVKGVFRVLGLMIEVFKDGGLGGALYGQILGCFLLFDCFAWYLNWTLFSAWRFGF